MASADSTNLRWKIVFSIGDQKCENTVFYLPCKTGTEEGLTVFIGGKKSAYKWTCAVQILVGQGSTVYANLEWTERSTGLSNTCDRLVKPASRRRKTAYPLISF